jgi:uncharacterized protein DUF6338
MDIPGSFAQLTIVLLFVVPGSVYQAVRERLRGPVPGDLNFSSKLFRALGVSAALMAVYITLGGSTLVRLGEERGHHTPSWQGVVDHARLSGAVGIVLLLIIPALLAVADYWRVAGKITMKNLTYDPTPRAWDYTFKDIEPCYVRVLTTDGLWLGGWFGERSFISSFPEPREMYIETAHIMSEDGTIGQEQPWSVGLYVRCDDIRAVELLRQPVASSSAEEEPDEQER